MKLKLIVLTCTLCSLLVLTSCENYSVNEDFNHIIKSDDLPFNLKVLEDNDHNFEIKKNSDSIQINVEDEFSASSGAIKISPNKNYKIKVKLKNNSSDPVIICSFWKSVISQSRQFILSGQNGNPPVAATQQQTNNWQEFEETFSTRPGEDFMVIRLLSNKGQFSINEIAIENMK